MKRLVNTVALAAAAASVSAAPNATVTGTMTINGAKVELRHAAAQAYTRPPGVTPGVYVVALTDRPLPEGALDGADGAAVRRLAYEKKVRGLMLLVDAADTAAAVAVTLDAFGTKNLKASIIKFGSPDWDDLADFKVAGGRISAKVVREWPNGEPKYRLAFDVPLTPEPGVVRDVQGKEAVRASPVWQAANAQVALMLKATPKSIQTLQAGYGPTARLQNEVALEHLVDDKGFVDMSRKRGAELKAVLDSATRVVERGRWATIVPADPKEKAIEMASDGAGKWLFGQ